MNIQRWLPLENLENQCIRIAIALMWWVSGLLPLIPSVTERAMSELAMVGLKNCALLFLAASMLLDILCGCCALWGRAAWVWWLQLWLVVAYSVILSISHTQLWLDPFGALLKNLPIIALLFWMAKQSNTSHK